MEQKKAGSKFNDIVRNHLIHFLGDKEALSLERLETLRDELEELRSELEADQEAMRQFHMESIYQYIAEVKAEIASRK